MNKIGYIFENGEYCEVHDITPEEFADRMVSNAWTNILKKSRKDITFASACEVMANLAHNASGRNIFFEDVIRNISNPFSFFI